MNKKQAILTFIFFLGFCATSLVVPNYLSAQDDVAANPRLKKLTPQDREMFESLSKEQQKNIQAQKVQEGYNAWMVELALGEPRFKSDQHPQYTNHEQVWLYTKDDVKVTSSERHFVNPENNWPSIEKVTITKTCKVGDFFLMFDRGVVTKITKANPKEVHGTCHINTVKEIIPVVNDKVKKLIKP